MNVNTGWNRWETLRELSVWELWIGRKILEADGSFNIDAIIAQAEKWEWVELEVLEKIITLLRNNKRYIATPEDAIKLVSHFDTLLSEGASRRKILSLIHIVAEFISNQAGYEFGNGDHDHVNEVYANQAILSENVYAALDYNDIEEIGSEVRNLSFTKPTQLSTEINTFLNVASTQERKYIQKIARVLKDMLWIHGEDINWSFIISTADRYMKSSNN